MIKWIISIFRKAELGSQGKGTENETFLGAVPPGWDIKCPGLGRVPWVTWSPSPQADSGATEVKQEAEKAGLGTPCSGVGTRAPGTFGGCCRKVTK